MGEQIRKVMCASRFTSVRRFWKDTLMIKKMNGNEHFLSLL